MRDPRLLADKIAPAVLVGAGAWQCIVVGEAINADGVSYLDLARQFSAGDWSAFANGYWSPLYPLTIGVLLRVVGWLGISELAITYSLNLALLVLASICFRKLLDELSVDAEPAAESREPKTENRRFGDPWSRFAAWALFAWIVIRHISVASITPDMLVAALFFYATSLIARRARAPFSMLDAHKFGAILGAAYLAKAVMFPAALVLLMAFAVVARRQRGPLSLAREMAGSLVVFGLIAIPLVVIQSSAAGKPTIGETGRLNYAWYVNSAMPTVTPVANLTRPPGSAIALSTIPGAQLFADSAPGSFPYWYDPARWSPGVEARFDAFEQWLVLGVTGRWYRMVAGVPLVVVLLFAGLALEAGRRPRRELWPLLAAPTALLLMYGLVHVEGRLIGAALVTTIVVMLAMADADGTKVQSQSRELLYAALVAFGVVGSVQRLVNGPRLGESRDATAVAAAIHQSGLTRGTDVAVLGSPLEQGIYWAHLAGVQVVATIPAQSAGSLTATSLAAFSAEACAEGRAIRTFVGRDSAWARNMGARALGDGWFAWLQPSPPSGCRRR